MGVESELFLETMMRINKENERIAFLLAEELKIAGGLQRSLEEQELKILELTLKAEARKKYDTAGLWLRS